VRRLLHTSLLADPLLAAEVGQRIYQASSLGVGDVPPEPQKPYVLYTELPSDPFVAVRETSRAKARFFQVYVYDDRGSFLRIERILALIRETLVSLVGAVSPSGVRCTDVLWQGESGEITDEEYDANSKFGNVRFVASQ
jgi:hypothetical protein